jgi:hypothetical protein
MRPDSRGCAADRPARPSEGDQIEETSPLGHIDQEIEVASFASLPPSSRAEDAHIARPMHSSNPRDLLARLARGYGGAVWLHFSHEPMVCPRAASGEESEMINPGLSLGGEPMNGVRSAPPGRRWNAPGENRTLDLRLEMDSGLCQSWRRGAAGRRLGCSENVAIIRAGDEETNVRPRARRRSRARRAATTPPRRAHHGAEPVRHRSRFPARA